MATEKEKPQPKASGKEEKLEYQPIPQMNIKKIGANPKEAVKQEKAVFMGRIYGECTSIKTKEARSGDVYNYMVGQFRAVNGAGEKFESEKLFLPGGIFETIESAWKAGGEQPVQFGYDIFAVPDTNSVGYRYSAKSLIKTEASDRLAGMSSQLDVKPLPGKAA